MTILWGGMRCVASKAGAYGAAPRPLQWPISDSFASGSATEPGLKKTVSTTDRLGHLHRWQKIGWRRVAWWILTLPKSCPPIPEIVRVPAVYHSPGVCCVTGARCSCIISKLSRCNSGKRPTPPSGTNFLPWIPNPLKRFDGSRAPTPFCAIRSDGRPDHLLFSRCVRGTFPAIWSFRL